jgi:hypothetical protein
MDAAMLLKTVVYFYSYVPCMPWHIETMSLKIQHWFSFAARRQPQLLLSAVPQQNSFLLTSFSSSFTSPRESTSDTRTAALIVPSRLVFNIPDALSSF